MSYRLRFGDQVEDGWHRKRDDALRHGESRGWTIQGPPGCYTLADGVEIEERSSPLSNLGRTAPLVGGPLGPRVAP